MPDPLDPFTRARITPYQTRHIIMMRGIPGSGKTTASVAWVRAHPWYVRIGIDELRTMLFAGQTFRREQEYQLLRARDVLVIEALMHAANVVVDATHIQTHHRTQLESIGIFAHAVVDVCDVPVALPVALERNAARPEAAQVPVETIQRMHEQYMHILEAESEERR
jgi:predicted kinase